MAFSVKKVGINFGGIPARGLANEDITWELDNDEATAYSDMRGTDGEIVYNGQTQGTCTVTLQARSPTNDLWAAAYAGQKATGTDLPLTMYDRNNDTKRVAYAPKATLQKTPPFTVGNSEPLVQYTFIFPTCVPPSQAGV